MDSITAQPEEERFPLAWALVLAQTAKAIFCPMFFLACTKYVLYMGGELCVQRTLNGISARYTGNFRRSLSFPAVEKGRKNDISGLAQTFFSN